MLKTLGYAGDLNLWPGFQPRVQGQRGFSTKWRLQFDDEWQQRKRGDAKLAAASKEIENCTAAKLVRAVDSKVDGLFVGLDSLRYRLCHVPLAGSSLLRIKDSSAAHLVDASFWQTPVRRVYPSQCDVPYWHLQKDWTRALSDKSVDTLIVLSLPFHKFLFRSIKQNLRKSLRYLEELNNTNRFLKLLRKETGLYVDFNSLLDGFEFDFLPKLLSAVNNEKDPVYEHFLKSHCTEAALCALKATKNPAAMSPELNVPAPADSRFTSVVKVEWKGAWRPRVAKDDTQGLLLFLITLREVADHTPREVTLSAAVAVEREAPPLSVKFRLREVVLLSSETFIV